MHTTQMNIKKNVRHEVTLQKYEDEKVDILKKIEKAETLHLLDVVLEEVIDYLPHSSPALDIINERLKTFNIPAVEIYYEGTTPVCYKKYINEELGNGLFACIDVGKGSKIHYIPKISAVLKGKKGVLSTSILDIIAGLTVEKYGEYVMPLPVSDRGGNVASFFTSKRGSKYTGKIKSTYNKFEYVNSAEVICNALKSSWQKLIPKFNIPCFNKIDEKEDFVINNEAVLQQMQLTYCPMTAVADEVTLINDPALFVNDPFQQKYNGTDEEANMEMKFSAERVSLYTTKEVLFQEPYYLNYSNVGFFAPVKEKEEHGLKNLRAYYNPNDLKVGLAGCVWLLHSAFEIKKHMLRTCIEIVVEKIKQFTPRPGDAFLTFYFLSLIHI